MIAAQQRHPEISSHWNNSPLADWCQRILGDGPALSFEGDHHGRTSRGELRPKRVLEMWSRSVCAARQVRFKGLRHPMAIKGHRNDLRGHLIGPLIQSQNILPSSSSASPFCDRLTGVNSASPSEGSCGPTCRQSRSATCPAWPNSWRCCVADRET